MNNCQNNSIVSNNYETVALKKCIDFLYGMGIPVREGKISVDSFLPGISIDMGSIIISPEALKYPGDILHEAGHIAVVPSLERKSLNAESIAKRKDREAEEMMAIAWSYAACVHLDLSLNFVFHDHGYKGGGNYIEEAFIAKKYFGLPMLQWIGLAADEKNAAMLNVPPFPKMLKWLRD